jgi:2,3-bisphosphoglycerate-independent phosphoglycerate mutase
MATRTKYVMVIPDGASDEPSEALGGLTPLQAARTPNMDRIAATGQLGLARNVPARFNPASDVATLSLLGYDPEVYYTGRAPLEAAAMGIHLGPDDWAIRCNINCILDGRMTDFTAGHITSDEGRPLIEALHAQLGSAKVEFHPGVSYRNLMIYRGTPGESPFDDTTLTTPPHDVPDQPSADHVPRGKGSEMLRELMAKGSQIVASHPVSLARKAHHPSNSIWLWGQGRRPSLRPFKELHGIEGAMIAAVDLVRGVAQLAGWARIDVPGATGYLDTDYAAKGRYGVNAIADFDFVCVHVEAPDEASHEGRPEAKVEALEKIDELIVGPLVDAVSRHSSWRALVTPDHSTLIRTRAHDRAPVPWAICGTGIAASGLSYNEPAAVKAGVMMLDPGFRLMEHFLLH